MKKTFVLLAGICLAASGAAKADSFNVKSAGVPVKTKAARPPRQVVYITNVTATGSHLPLVVTKYGNNVHSTSSLVAYSQPQLDQTGQLNVGAQITQRDPAVSSFRGRR